MGRSTFEAAYLGILAFDVFNDVRNVTARAMRCILKCGLRCTLRPGPEMPNYEENNVITDEK